MDAPMHPGAKALRRTLILLVLFTTPAVLALMGVIPEPQNPSGALLALMMGGMMVGLIGPPVILWNNRSAIAQYLEGFPRIRRVAGVVVLLGGIAMLGLGYKAISDPTIQGRKTLPFVFGSVMVLGGWKMVRGKPQ